MIRALQRDEWNIVRQKDSNIRLQKNLENETLKLTVPAHDQIKRSTLSHLLKQARVTLERLKQLL